MIWDSGPWKDELLTTATKLEQIATRRRPSNRLIVELEKAVFLAAYAVRKLIEAKLLSTDCNPIDVRTFPAKGKPVTLMNWHRIDDLYDFGTPHGKKMAPRCLVWVAPSGLRELLSHTRMRLSLCRLPAGSSGDRSC